MSQLSTKNLKNPKKFLRSIALATVVVSSVIALLIMLIIPALGWGGLSANFVRALQVFLPWALLNLAGVSLVSLGVMYEKSQKFLMAAGILLIAGWIFSGLGVLSSQGIGTIVSALNRAGHEARTEYVENLQEIESERPSYDERIAREQAKFQIRRSLSGVVGEVSDPIRVDAEWCSFVITSAEIRNRWMESVICINDDGIPRRVQFNKDSVPTPIGFRKSNIKNVIASEVGLTARFDKDDIYGFITEEDGELVANLAVPIFNLRGVKFYIPLIPDGAAIFNKDGIQVFSDVAPGEIPGPIAGISMAERVREAANDRLGFLVSKKPARSPLSIQETDSDDPNSGNPTEFILSRDGGTYAVTPLTSFGGSSVTVGFLEVRMDTIIPGESPEATIYRLPEPEGANSTIANTIRAIYAQDLDSTDLIYEITPAEAGVSRVTIGTEDLVRFVARSDTGITNSELSGEICISSRNGVELDCSSLRSNPKPLGTLVSGPTRSDGESSSSGIDLKGITTQELLDEIARRIPDSNLSPSETSDE